MNAEMKWGGAILSLYALWSLTWFFVSSVLRGSFSHPYRPEADLTRELQAPFEGEFLMGTDLYGHSLWEILSAGINYSLTVAMAVTVAAAFLGLVMGHLSVTGPPLAKFISDTATNVIFVFPSILIAIMIMAMTGQSFWGLVFALVATSWPGYARIARGEVKRILGLSYVESARAIGVSSTRLFFTIVIPSLFPVYSIHLILGLSGVVISEATLGFLGLGGGPYSWGAMLASAKMVLLEAPYLAGILSLAMAGLIIGLNLLGDGLRDYLDPTS